MSNTNIKKLPTLLALACLTMTSLNTMSNPASAESKKCNQ